MMIMVMRMILMVMVIMSIIAMRMVMMMTKPEDVPDNQPGAHQGDHGVCADHQHLGRAAHRDTGHLQKNRSNQNK